MEQTKDIYKIGIIGTGRIAGRFIPEARFVDGIQVQGVYNPHMESAAQFAARWGIRAYKTQEEMFQNADLVYVASPHETHHPYVKAALERGKHVLCEKPMVFAGGQAKELFAYAEEHELILMEGIKTAYCPGFGRLLELVAGGVIGRVRYVEACFTKLESESSRELTDQLYGGSFIELGSYCLLPIVKLLGSGYEDVQFDSIRGENGLDLFTKASFRYQGVLAEAVCGLGVKADGRLMIAGTKGYIMAEAPWWKTTRVEVHYENPWNTQQYQEMFLGDGLRYEIGEFLNRVNRIKDSAHSSGLTAGDSIAIADIMERFMMTERKTV